MMSVFKFGGGSNGAQTLGSFISRTPSLLGPYHTTKRDENHKLQRISNLKFLFLFYFLGKIFIVMTMFQGGGALNTLPTKSPLIYFSLKKSNTKRREREREKKKFSFNFKKSTISCKRYIYLLKGVCVRLPYR